MLAQLHLTSGLLERIASPPPTMADAAMRTNMIVSCSFYLVSSAGMSVFNKLAILALPLPITLVMVQMVFTCASIGASWRSVHIGSRRDALRSVSYTHLTLPTILLV